jgi:hypothetical protein
MFATTIKRGDVGVRISDTLVLDGDPVDLTGKDVWLNVRLSLEGVSFRRQATVVSPETAGNVFYDVVLGDFSIPGVYLTEWEVSDVNGNVQLVPEDRYNKLIVETDLCPETATLPGSRVETAGTVLHGSGSPEGVVVAGPGALYVDTTSGMLYMKLTGTGATGWSS